jgi:hypothetical protein
MSLSGAAAALGLPEALVERSAAARAAATGSNVDEILAAWAGGEASPPSGGDVAVADATAAPESGTETPVEEAPEPVEEAPAPEIAAPAAAAAAPPTSAPTRAPVPAEVTAAEAANLPEVITVPTAGIRERTNFVIPKWLVALMLATPLVALFALGGASTGACGEATELTVDVITGEAVNCDGTEFTGGGAGGGTTDFIALGGELYAGAVTPAATCAGCHGAGGEGSGSFPPLTGVITTFGSCADHIQWVLLGSSGWAAEVGDTYGDTNKPVNTGMPPHAALTDEQLRSVVAFERVRFGGANPDEVLADCGLVEAEGEGGEGAVPPEEGEGEAPTGTTVPAEPTTTASG